MIQLDEEIDPDAVAEAVRSCPGVADLSGGLFGEAATYLPGRRVNGVRLADDRVEIHVVLDADARAPEVAEQIRTAVLGIVRRAVDRQVPVDVVIDDVDLQLEPEPEPDQAPELERGTKPAAELEPGPTATSASTSAATSPATPAATAPASPPGAGAHRPTGAPEAGTSPVRPPVSTES